ncbi:MAG: cytochrome c family protein [Pseudomonadota bacterium]
MLDTMTMTKVVASICGAWLILLLANWAGEGLFHVSGHGEQAFVVEVEDASEPQEEVVQVPFEEVYAAADASKGERLWRACQACHALEDGKNGTGPHLFAVVGRDKGSVAGYSYSDAMATQEGDWTPENLSGFLESPRNYTPGTKMSYSGMGDVEDRANLIAYLAGIGG